MKSKLLMLLLIISICFSSITFSTKEVQAKEYTIKDVEVSDDAYEDIQSVLNQGWMSLTLNKFFPDKKITRGEFAMILTKWNSQLSKVTSVKKVSFKDVTIKDKYGKYIELQKQYITYYKKKDGNYYKPDNYITREDALVAFVKVLGYDSDTAIGDGAESEIDLLEIIEDSGKISSALKELVSIGVTNELMGLVEKGDSYYLYPKSYITRRQMAQLMANAEQAKEYNKVDDSNEEDVTTDEDEVLDEDEFLDEDEDIIYNDTNSNTGTSGGTNSSNSNSNSYVNNDLGYLSINVNGKEMIYKPKYTSNLGDYWSFFSDKYSNKNMFSIQLPTDIEVGDSITVNSYDDTLFYPMSVQYTNSSGELFIFGYPLGHFEGGKHSSSRVTITITERGKKGGYVSGTINGELVFSDETITFSNGVFRFKLTPSSF